MSIRFGHGDRPMLAGQSYTLECVVQKVAPVKNLKVTFYKGQEALAQKNSATGEEKPVDEIFNFSFRATEEDDGAMFWCHAQLDLEMQQAPPAALSQHLQATVYCEYCGFSSFPPFLFTVSMTRCVFFLSITIQTCLGSYHSHLQVQLPS